MPNQQPFETNLLRVIAAELRMVNMMIAAPVKSGRPFLDLEAQQRMDLYANISRHIGDFARANTPEALAGIDAGVGLHTAPISEKPQ